MGNLRHLIGHAPSLCWIKPTVLADNHRCSQSINHRTTNINYIKRSNRLHSRLNRVEYSPGLDWYSKEPRYGLNLWMCEIVRLCAEPETTFSLPPALSALVNPTLSAGILGRLCNRLKPGSKRFFFFWVCECGAITATWRLAIHLLITFVSALKERENPTQKSDMQNHIMFTTRQTHFQSRHW